MLGAGAVVAVPAGQRPILVSDTTTRGLAAGNPADAIPDRARSPQRAGSAARIDCGPRLERSSGSIP